MPENLGREQKVPVKAVRGEQGPQESSTQSPVANWGLDLH